MKSKSWLVILLTLGILAAAGSGAMAHDLWLAPETGHPAVGDTLQVRLGFGHKFPADRIDEKVRADTIKQVSALGPDGKEIALTRLGEDLYSLPIKAQGPYLISALMESGFYSRGAEGMKRGNKKDLAGVTDCRFYRMTASAPVTAGKGGGVPAAAPAGQALQVLPLAAVGSLKNGDTLPVKVLFQGTPLAGVRVRATYAGYQAPQPAQSDKPDPNLSPREAAAGRAKGHGAHHFPVDVKTDARGVAQLKLTAPGWWLVLTGHKTAYPDSAVCDQNVFKTTYTFQVR